MVANEVTNQNDTRMVVNKGLITNRDKARGLKLKGSNDASPLLSFVDSQQVIKELQSSQIYLTFTYFFTFTYNMRRNFGINPIEQQIDSDEWKNNFLIYDNLKNRRKKEIKDSLNQAAAPLLL